MGSINKRKLVRFQVLRTTNPFKKFSCLTKRGCVVDFIKVFIEWVYFSHSIQRDRILCYFDKQIGSGSANLPIFRTGIYYDSHHK